MLYCDPLRGAPPHTRGSTLTRLACQRHLDGSPAHAGIDPCTIRSSALAAGLPRTRGDRPPLSFSAARWSAAPPHTRGSTRSSASLFATPQGSPAHAGIDLSNQHPPARARRLPRTRGDRPASRAAGASQDMAPPHTRGSTLLFGFLATHSAGSPAHAGIDLIKVVRLITKVGLPRTRGDRPVIIYHTLELYQAPPHTRGSTYLPGLEPDQIAGSPAHAGIDPYLRPPSDRDRRLPRTRGDRPDSFSAAAS